MRACFVLNDLLKRCCGCAGLGAPLIVPPIRNAMNRPEPVAPPKLADVRRSLLQLTS